MQESPNFTTYLSRFRNADRATVLDLREQITGNDKNYLQSVYERLELYFQDEDFRSQIPLQTRTAIEENDIVNILSSLENLASWQRDGSTIIAGGNLQNSIQNIIPQVNSMDQRISGNYFAYLSSSEPLGKRIQAITALAASAQQESDTLAGVLKSVESQVNERKSGYDTKLTDLENEAASLLAENKMSAEKTIKDMDRLLVQAKLLTSGASGNKLGDYYQKLSNGRTLVENGEYIEARGKKLATRMQNVNMKLWASWIGLVALVVYVFVMYCLYNPIKLDQWGITLCVVVGSGITVLAIIFTAVAATKNFNHRFKGGHERASASWMVGAIMSTIATAIYASMLIQQLSLHNGSITWEQIIPKIIVLLAPAYLVRLCVQNYRANAHLAVQYGHRATIMSIAATYSDATTIDTTEASDLQLGQIALNAKMMILTDAAKIMFAQSESGYITQKEGAGSAGDDMLSLIRSNIQK